jgi:membrane peptidoglycan carboxypeptidase
MLQGVITDGTGRNAALPDRPVAGKTGTTENYGDAWFVGYTPQLVTAVWVGYPNGLRPMLSEYQGRAVAGGTFPAQIWKTFMQSALKELGAEPQSFPSPPYLSAWERRVTYRDGQVQLDNGRCHDTSLVVYFAGKGPAKTANCKLNEVEVPDVVGYQLVNARIRLEAQPLTPQLIYKPAKPGQRVDIVLRQFPRAGRLSSFDKVTIVLAKPQHGVVPKIVGLTLRQARAKLHKLKLQPTVRFGSGKPGRVIAQEPLAGRAAAPGMKVQLIVARG